MDFLQKRIREKLIQRGNSERQRAEEWERSLKPTTYLGKNLYQELGGTPIEGRYLGQVGMIPGQSVPNIGRNPNKPVIPGLPQIVIPEPEEGGVIQQIIPTYSAIFTREVAGGRTQWTELEMMQRSQSTHNDWLGGSVGNLLAQINGLMNDREYYYWNGSNIQKLFTHQSAELVSSGTAEYNGNRISFYTFPDPLDDLQNGMADINTAINRYASFSYIVILKDRDGNIPRDGPDLYCGGAARSLVGVRNQITVNGSNYFISQLAITQQLIDVRKIFLPWTIEAIYTLIGQSEGVVDYEVYKVWADASYFTTTNSGTAFAHITNGIAGDERTRIRYFSGDGKQPFPLTQTNLSQAQSEEYWSGVQSYPSYDWRSPWLTSTQSLVNNNSQRFFSGLSDSAIQYGSLNASGGLAYFYSERTAGALAFMDYIFNGNGTDSTFSNAITYNASSYDSSTGLINATDGDDIELTWPQVDLTALGTEGVDWYIEDICLPDIWTANGVANSYWLFPMIAIYPYHKKIFF